MTGKTWAVAGLMLVTGLAPPPLLLADVIHLKNGSRIEVDAWRDLGDAIEFASGGGLVRISKVEVQKIDGKPTRGALRMYPSGPAGGPVASLDRAAAATQMLELLGRAEGLLGQEVMSADEKAGAFRRLVASWQGFEAPAEFGEAYSKGQKALQAGVDVFAAEDAGSEVGGRVEALRKELREAQEEIKKAAEGKREG